MSVRSMRKRSVPGPAVLVFAGFLCAPGLAQEIGDINAAMSGARHSNTLTPSLRGTVETGGAEAQTADTEQPPQFPSQGETGSDETAGMETVADETAPSEITVERLPELDTADPGPSTLDAIMEEAPGAGTGTHTPSLEYPGQGRPGVAGTGLPPRTPDGTDPLSVLRATWRTAVETGGTELGFAAWAAGLLAAEPGQDAGTPSPGPTVKPGTTHSERTRMASERWLARAGPVAMGQAGRVVTTFGAAIPTAFCAPLTVCYIELEPGETLTDTPSWGDAVRWQVVVKTQGHDPETVLLEIKPSEDAEITNLVIPTDRRVYTINLVNDPTLHTPILSFHYPDSAARAIAEKIEADRVRKAERQAATDAARAAEVARTGVRTSTGTRPAADLDFGFRVNGTARFKPVRVYTDGNRTFIDLHPDYRGELPTVLPGPGEANKALNTRVTGNGTRLEADRVITDVYLQAGRQRVRIRRAGS